MQKTGSGLVVWGPDGSRIRYTTDKTLYGDTGQTDRGLVEPRVGRLPLYDITGQCDWCIGELWSIHLLDLSSVHLIGFTVMPVAEITRPCSVRGDDKWRKVVSYHKEHSTVNINRSG
jgi:hypothetical protein